MTITSRMKISDTGYWDAETACKYHTTSVGLAKWIARFLKEEKTTQLYDFGCGAGGYLRHLALEGFSNLVGFEGAPPIPREFSDVRQQDLTRPFYPREGLGLGNVICLEVGEHIPGQFENEFLDNITRFCSGWLIMSWAVRGQGGDGHVNCLDNYEVIPKVESRGFGINPRATRDARQAVDDSLFWLRGTVLVFDRRGLT